MKTKRGSGIVENNKSKRVKKSRKGRHVEYFSRWL
jgi:hypothetical protein